MVRAHKTVAKANKNAAKTGTTARPEVPIRNVDAVPATPLPPIPNNFRPRTGKLPPGFRIITDAQRTIAGDVLDELARGSFAVDWGVDAPDPTKVIERGKASVGWDDFRIQAENWREYANTMSLASWNSFLNLVAPMREVLGVSAARNRLQPVYPKTVKFLTAREAPAARGASTKHKAARAKAKAKAAKPAGGAAP